MAAKRRRMVIDASVAASAGDGLDGPSHDCRVWLEATMLDHHLVVFTPAISAEWNRHQSARARLWRREMMKRRLVVKCNPERDPELRVAVESYSVSPDSVQSHSTREAMLKDVHVVEAAMATDRVVASLDDRARGHFDRFACTYRRLRRLMWVNPCAGADVLGWLRRGARDDQEHMLCRTRAE